jgi:hypothetical protein
MVFTGTGEMDEQTNRPAPRHVVESLDASVNDLKAGRVHDASGVQAEARRMLDEQRRKRASVASPGQRGTAARTRSTS